MAELKFKGKKMVWNHHLSVPYHTLDEIEKLGYKADKTDGNLIVEGDNLPALKSLLPQYAGKIKCIYIDPPYNTGNEGWVYNDNVNSPLIKEWLGKEVGSDDLTRHDKWLSMMTPRLKLVRELLSEDGVFLISIDDNELHHLRMLLDEIFGEENFISTLIWNYEGNIDNQSRIKENHEYILLYVKEERLFDKPLVIDPNIPEDSKLYNNQIENSITKNGPANPESEVELPVGFPTISEKLELGIRDNVYPHILKPVESEDFRLIKPTVLKSGWSSRNLLDEFIANDCKPILDSENKSTTFALTDTGAIYVYKHRLGEQSHFLSVLKNFGTTKQNSNMLKSFELDFAYPKPVSLIKYLLKAFTKTDSLILDAFAGSGTTAEAVLKLNEEDDGNRKFIMIQMPENSDKEPDKNICKDITRERIVKVIENKLDNKDVGFEYRKVGQPIDAETILSGQLPTFEQLAKYVFYLATGQTPKKEDISKDKHIAGKIGDTSVYLLYEDSLEELQRMALTHDFAKDLPKGKKIVYAPACFLDDDYLSENDIRFVSIPYNLFERPE